MNPAAPVTSTLLMEETTAHGVEFINGAHVIARPADIQPVAVESAHHYGFLCRDEVEHQMIEPIEPVLRNVLENPCAEHINAHAHLVVRTGFFTEPNEPAVAVDVE